MISIAIWFLECVCILLYSHTLRESMRIWYDSKRDGRNLTILFLFAYLFYRPRWAILYGLDGFVRKLFTEDDGCVIISVIMSVIRTAMMPRYNIELDLPKKNSILTPTYLGRYKSVIHDNKRLYEHILNYFFY